MKTEQIINDNTNIWIKQSDMHKLQSLRDEITDIFRMLGDTEIEIDYEDDFVSKYNLVPIVRKIRLGDGSILDLEVDRSIIVIKFLYPTDLEKKENTLLFCSENLFTMLHKEWFPECILSCSIDEKQIGVPKEYLVDYYPIKEVEMIFNILTRYKKNIAFI